jgi:hypothetical protein
LLQWTIKAKLVRKAPPRSFNNRAGTPTRVFNVELADAAVSGAQGCFAQHRPQLLCCVVQFLCCAFAVLCSCCAVGVGVGVVLSSVSWTASSACNAWHSCASGADNIACLVILYSF